MILLNIALWLLVLAPVLFFVYMLWAERQVAKGMDRLYEKWRKEDREREKLKTEIEKKTAEGAFKITEQFEQAVADYTGAPYAVAFDSQSSAMEACLIMDKVTGQTIRIPSRTYMSVPSCVILTGNKVEFIPGESETITGYYLLGGTRIWDSALRFTADMHLAQSLVCLSFSGPFKHLKLGKGGMVLCSNESEAKWLKKYRFNGRNECSYHTDHFDMVGRNCYMLPEIAAKGLRDMAQFYNQDGSKRHNEDITLPYPDLSKFPIYGQS